MAGLVGALLCAGGCLSFDIFSPSEPEGPDIGPTYFDRTPRVRPGVALVVVVSSGATQPVTMQVLVDQNGDITLPHLLQSPVACDGLTLDALKQKLTKVYSDYYKQPQITVTFAPYDGRGVSPWGTVKVLGEVVSPGPVNMPSTMDLTVTKVLQAAGGLRPFADKTKIRVSRRDKDGKVTRYKIDLVEIGEKGMGEKDILLHAGDVVFVPETWY
ncbi:MAG: polysaccharide biosynthesis/export family protein [Kiritimatiellae bacterium]|nr:polysaccharide biosynthesis/export family protein [Kiritimatiellia bacterium]